MSKRPKSDDPHEWFKVVRVDQGWKTGLGRCKCGAEFPVQMSVEKYRGRDRIMLVPGASCPNRPAQVSR